jgi:UDP-N-acetylglucosamine 2-epimerase (non-hydrolysing)
MKVLHILGARPNFMKGAPVIRALGAHAAVEQVIVHTGQHYDVNMSDVFFEQLGMPHPDVNLQVGSGSHARQTAEIMTRLEPIVLESHPDYVVVYGDVNSTVAAALVCSKLGIRVVHVEAGLRSFDRTMPEEINRIVTDSLSDILLTPSEDADRNLLREGVNPEKIRFVGNVMIDTLIRMLPVSANHLPSDAPRRFVLVTLHRPSNVDDVVWLKGIVQSLQSLATDVEVIFPVHPRTRARFAEFGLNGNLQNLRLTEPLPYLAFLALQRKAMLVITDSGGIQEETTFLGVPCLTVRENTERPITIEVGTNILVGRDLDRITQTAHAIINGQGKKGIIPPLWDGRAAERIAKILTN